MPVVTTGKIEQLRNTFCANGYSEDHIERMIMGKKTHEKEAATYRQSSSHLMATLQEKSLGSLRNTGLTILRLQKKLPPPNKIQPRT